MNKCKQSKYHKFPNPPLPQMVQLLVKVDQASERPKFQVQMPNEWNALIGWPLIRGILQQGEVEMGRMTRGRHRKSTCAREGRMTSRGPDNHRRLAQ